MTSIRKLWLEKEARCEMKAVITGETDKLVGVNLRDNNGEEHILDVEKDSGEITAHKSDGYPDDSSNRSVPEHEHVNQTQRFAKFYVYREKGYDTVDPKRNPDRIVTAALAVASLSPDRFREYFGDSYQQLLSHQTDADPIVELPPEAADEIPRIGQDIYLRTDETALASIVETLSDAGVFDHLETAAESVAADESLPAAFQRVLEIEDVDLREDASQVGDALLETVAPVSVRWTSNGTDAVEKAESQSAIPDREPDARPQMPPSIYEFDSLEDFQQSLVYHLLCQVRDCYLEMGIAPPEDVRILGPGFYENIGWYRHHDVYPDYYDIGADITDWQEEHTPDELRA